MEEENVRKWRGEQNGATDQSVRRKRCKFTSFCCSTASASSAFHLPNNEQFDLVVNCAGETKLGQSESVSVGEERCLSKANNLIKTTSNKWLHAGSKSERTSDSMFQVYRVFQVYRDGIYKLSMNCATEAAKRSVACYIEISTAMMHSSDTVRNLNTCDTSFVMTTISCSFIPDLVAFAASHHRGHGMRTIHSDGKIQTRRWTGFTKN